MRRFLLTALVFLFGLIAVDQAVGLLLRNAFDRAMTGDSGAFINGILSEAGDADVVVFGSSRAIRHVDTEALGEALGVRAYNAGVDGQRVLAARGIQALLLESGADVRVFVLQVEPRDLYWPEPSRALVLTPFAANDDVRSILNNIDPWMGLKLVSATYPFNSKVFGILSNFGSAAPTDRFAPLDGQMHDAPSPSNTAGELPLEAPHPLIVQAHIDFVDAAVASGGHVVLFGGPRYRSGGRTPQDEAAYAFFAALADDREQVSFVALDEVSHPEWLRPELFADSDHLNREGARLLTDALAGVVRAALEPASR